MAVPGTDHIDIFLRDNVRTIEANPLPGETLAPFSDFARQGPA